MEEAIFKPFYPGCMTLLGYHIWAVLWLAPTSALTSPGDPRRANLHPRPLPHPAPRPRLPLLLQEPKTRPLFRRRSASHRSRCSAIQRNGAYRSEVRLPRFPRTLHSLPLPPISPPPHPVPVLPFILHGPADVCSLRLLASTGAQSQAPLFNVGIFTSFGLKLGEGHGSSLRMAEHRAAVNALLAHFLVRGDQARRAGPVPATRSGLPSSAHVAFPVDGRGLLSADGERFEGGGFGGRETVVESGRAGTRGGRLKGAARTTAL